MTLKKMPGAQSIKDLQSSVSK